MQNKFAERILSTERRFQFNFPISTLYQRVNEHINGQNNHKKHHKSNLQATGKTRKIYWKYIFMVMNDRGISIQHILSELLDVLVDQIPFSARLPHV